MQPDNLQNKLSSIRQKLFPSRPIVSTTRPQSQLEQETKKAQNTLRNIISQRRAERSTATERFFAPTEKVRVRDVLREVPRETGIVAKEAAQGFAREIAGTGQLILNKIYGVSEKYQPPENTLGRVLFGRTKPFSLRQEGEDVLRSFGASEETIDKWGMPLAIGFVALDAIPGGEKAVEKATKTFAKEFAKLTDEEAIFKGLRTLFKSVDIDDELRPLAKEIAKETNEETILKRIVKFSKDKERLATQAETKAIVEKMKAQEPELTPTVKAVEKVTPEQSLFKEARKYKTPEGFVKAQGKPVYHGTTDISLKDIKISESGDLGPGFYLTRDKGVAEQFSDPAFRSSALERVSKNQFVDINTGDRVTFDKSGIQEFGVDGLNIKKMTPEQWRVEIEKLRDPKTNSLPKGFEVKIQSKLESEGFDALEILGKSQQIVVFPSKINKIKTRSQLTDIWNKANKEAKDKISQAYEKPVENVTERIKLKGTTKASQVLDDVKPIENTPVKASKAVAEMGDKTPIQVPDETIMGYLQRKIQDKFNRLNLFQKKIFGKGEIPENFDAYLQQELYQGATMDRLVKFEEYYSRGKDSLVLRMDKDNISIDDIGEYMHAKHAQERNARVAKVNPKIPDGGSGMTNAKAVQVLEKYKGKADIYEKYAKEIQEKIIKPRLKILKEEGLMKSENIDTIAGTFDNYVPLKVPQEKEFRLRGGKGFDVRGKDVKGLKGSLIEQRTNPVIQAILDYEDTIIKSEKNKVGLKLKKLIESNPDVVNQQGKKLWTIEKQKYAPVYNELGEVEYMMPRGFKLADNVLEVRENGTIYHITIEDKALASAMKNLGSERGIKFLQTINAYLRGVITSFNPSFIVTNFERDLQTALINVAGEKGTAMATDVVKNIPKAMKGIWRDVRGIETEVKKGIDWAKEYKQLKELGGRVGWFDNKTVAEKTLEVQKRINYATGKDLKTRVLANLDAAGDYVSNVNEVVESGVRLSAFHAAKQAGMSPRRAASFAKNLTVNFNKKGEWGAVLNSLYLFANAGIQGSANVITRLKYKGVRRLVYLGAALGFANAEMNRHINEEEYEKISDWEKNTSWIFMLPDGIDSPKFDNKIVQTKTTSGGSKYLKIKLPYGYNIFKVAGELGSELKNRAIDEGEAIKRLVFAADESFNPLSSGSPLQLVSPTITDPLVQMYENKNFFGGPIKPEQPVFGPQKKQSSLYFSSVREPTKAFTEWLNDITGGNVTEAGLVDVSPENVDYLIDFLGGGTAKFIADTIDTGASLVKGDLPKTQNTPFINKFIGEVYENVESSKVYDFLDQSEVRVLNKKETERFYRYGKEAYEEGQIDQKAAKRIVTEFQENQARIHASRIIDEMGGAKTSQEREKIFNQYISENSLDKSKDAVLEQYKELVKNIAEQKEVKANPMIEKKPESQRLKFNK